VGCGFRQMIVNLASYGVLESGALQLSNAPSLKQIAQDFLIFLGKFPTYCPKWTDMFVLSKKSVNSAEIYEHESLDTLY